MAAAPQRNGLGGSEGPPAQGRSCCRVVIELALARPSRLQHIVNGRASDRVHVNQVGRRAKNVVSCLGAHGGDLLGVIPLVFPMEET